MNTIQTFFINILGIAPILDNHKSALEEIVQASNANGTFFNNQLVELNKQIEVIQKSQEVLYNSLPKNTKKVLVTKGKRAKRVIHKK